MNFITRCRNAWNAFAGQPVGLGDEELLAWLGIDRDGMNRKKMSEVTYFTCLKMLSETMGKLPLKFYQETESGRIRAEPSETARVLTVRPNGFMTPSTLWGTVEMNCEHYGNGYIWLRRMFEKKGRYGGEYRTLDAWPMQSSYVSVLMDNAGIFGAKGRLWYQYSDPRTGELYVLKSDDVIHIKTWYSLDGILGEPVKNILKHTIDGASASQDYMNNLYENGLTASMAMQYTGDFDDDKRKKMMKKYGDYLTGPKSAGKVVPVPMGLTLTPLKMSLVDAQFFELKKYSALQIAGAFGIKPNQINNYEKSSYSNSESQQLAFLIDTMSYRLKQYEEEINAKALSVEEQRSGYFFKFNEKAILRSNAKEQVATIKDAIQNGLYTVNEGRELLDKPRVPGGDITMVNGNFIPITQVGNQYKKGGGDSGES